MNKKTSLQLNKVSVTVGAKIVNQQIDLTVHAGQITALLGVNGSGKSSLCKAIIGHPDFKIKSGQIFMNGEDLSKMNSWQRSRAGLFASWQQPLEIPGLNFYQLLLAEYSAQSTAAGPEVFEQRLRQGLEELKLPEDFLQRDLNVGFSGGEKKKAEILQLFVMRPHLVLLDEIDSGLDVDALKIISRAIKQLANEGVGFLIITHYAKLLHYLQPQEVLVMIDGRIVKKGRLPLVKQIEQFGYEKLFKSAEKLK